MTEPEKAKPKKPPRYPKLRNLRIDLRLEYDVGPDDHTVLAHRTDSQNWPYQITFGCQTISLDETDVASLRLLFTELPKLP